MLQEIGVLPEITKRDVFDDATYQPDDWVLATGETHTVKEFAKLAFSELGLNWEDYVVTSDKYSQDLTKFTIFLVMLQKAKKI